MITRFEMRVLTVVRNIPAGRVATYGDVAAMARYAGMNSCCELERFFINSGYSSVALIQRPDRTAASGKEPRLRSNGYGFDDCAC